MTHSITLIPGDGIGPEVARATQRVVEAAGVDVIWDVQDVGAAVADRTGGPPLPEIVLESIRKNRVALKGPVGTPIGKGFKSVNVTLRQALDLYANVRPVRSLPYVEPRFEGIDFTIVRENTEDLYAGHEIMVLPGIAQSIKLITEKGSTRIAQYAFEYARKHGRKRVSAIHKANIMKMTDGLMLECTRAVAKNFPEIELVEVIVDAAAMTMVRNANVLDVIVTENLYGDILSDLGAGLVGGLGIVPGANIGAEYAVFEAVHGSAPDIAGKGVANPTALIQSAVMMLYHLNEDIAAQRIELALHGIYASRSYRTRDLGGTAGTEEFTDALCLAVVKLTEPPAARRSGSIPAPAGSIPAPAGSIPASASMTPPPGSVNPGQGNGSQLGHARTPSPRGPTTHGERGERGYRWIHGPGDLTPVPTSPPVPLSPAKGRGGEGVPGPCSPPQGLVRHSAKAGRASRLALSPAGGRSVVSAACSFRKSCGQREPRGAASHLTNVA